MAKIFSTTPIIGIDLTKVYRRTEIDPIPGPSTVAFGSDGYKYVFAMLVENLAIGRQYVGIVEGMDHPTPLAFDYSTQDLNLYTTGDAGQPINQMKLLSKWQIILRNPGANDGALIQHARGQIADRYIHAGNAQRATHGTQRIPRFKRVGGDVLLAAETYAWFRALKI